ncbi:Transglutaminase elicitor [Phytophthora megakarya]|uniref:Transglutaminase elicitor n=1 Tax=Phytophthora megakarya TaxID=4795 RepID=A0A225WA94_9STRA|nr:Transglutaminase elicitor [Phytophthora megakarya]
MVYTPRAYLVSAAVALVATQMQYTAATSLYFTPFTSSQTDGTMSGKFPGRSNDIPDQDCAITVPVDPTMPDLATISTVPVTYPDLLANLTTTPAHPLSGKVGKSILSEPIPATDADQDGYIGGSSIPVKMPTTKAGISNPSSGSPKDCATGWDSTTTQAKIEKKRRLEANTNKDIAKLEAYFGKPMEMNLKKLPPKAVHNPSPWPGPYWPTYQDGINVQWSEGEASPAEKYAKAFGLDVKDFMDKVSKDNGIDSMSKRPKCTSDDDCKSLPDGSACGIRDGASSGYCIPTCSGYCIPTWFGICHAWTPASIMEAEPNCPVTHNGVTFHPMDLKALVSDIYDGAQISTVFTGTRFNGGSDSTDEYGRHSSDAYRDLNPAFFHITAANLLGNLNATFVADVTAGAEVWNQPVRGFKVYEQTEMSLEEAAQTFYGLEKYPWNAAAKSIVYVKTRLSWIFETYTDGGLVKDGQVDKFTTGAYYTYLLEMDDDGNIIGGEWVYNSDADHPDFIWFPKSKPAADTVTSVGLSYADVSMLLEKSVACSDSSAGSNTGSTTGSAPTGSAGSVPASASSSGSGSAPTGSEGSATETPSTDAPSTSSASGSQA